MKPGMWFVTAGVLGLLAIILSFSFFGSGMSPQAYVDNNYRKVSEDSDVKTYEADEPPTTVAGDIVDQWRPVSQFADSSGVYLRYSRDGINIAPRGENGSTIRVMSARHMHGLFFAHVGGFWGWTSNYGEDFRGRGPSGGGK